MTHVTQSHLSTLDHQLTHVTQSRKIYYCVRKALCTLKLHHPVPHGLTRLLYEFHVISIRPWSPNIHLGDSKSSICLFSLLFMLLGSTKLLIDRVDSITPRLQDLVVCLSRGGTWHKCVKYAFVSRRVFCFFFNRIIFYMVFSVSSITLVPNKL